MMKDEQTRNLLIAALLSFLLIGVWSIFIDPPQVPVETESPVEDTAATEAATPTEVTAPAASLGEAEETAIAPVETRIRISTPSLFGSVSLRGGRIDDLSLANYRETIESNSDPVRLLSPSSGSASYYAVYGWVPRSGTADTPGPTTEWTKVSGDILQPGRPITLEWKNGNGLTFERRIDVDDGFLFTIEQTVRNNGASAVTLAPYGIIARHGEPETVGFYILHEGPLGMFDGQLKELDYDDLTDFTPLPNEGGPAERIDVVSNGWLGFTDKYWMTTLVPASGQPFTAVYKSAVSRRGPIFQTDMRLPAITVQPGETATASTYLFSGAKEVATIRGYQDELGIERFEDAVDWGWFFFLTKPIFRLLLWVQGYVGNMGYSIILLTFLVKAGLFPLAFKSYTSMARMKKLQPEMEKIKERVGDDRSKLQQEMMGLYKKEKVNPAAGCVPIILQIPIFFSLYKVLFVTIEMRHAPFIGWIRDLAAPDPTTMFNLFGLIPWTPPEILGIGFWPIFMGVTMWLQMKLNPAPTDPIQQKIFAWMPVMFTFLLGRFPAGLVIYWTANNLLTLSQQYAIMRSQGVDVDLFGNIRTSFQRKGSSGPTRGT